VHGIWRNYRITTLIYVYGFKNLVLKSRKMALLMKFLLVVGLLIRVYWKLPFTRCEHAECYKTEELKEKNLSAVHYLFIAIRIHGIRGYVSFYWRFWFLMDWNEVPSGVPLHRVGFYVIQWSWILRKWFLGRERLSLHGPGLKGLFIRRKTPVIFGKWIYLFDP
jgi:hypothetical protein